MTHISELHRYPVKSLLGERIEATAVTRNGFPGDRAWAIRDDKQTLNGKKFPALMSAQATFAESPSAERSSSAINITLPGGELCNSNDSNIAAWLTSYLGHDATLWPLVDADNLDFYRRAETAALSPEETEAMWRAVFARLPHEPLPDLSTFPAELFEFDSPPGTYFDAFPLLIVSKEAQATLAAGNTEQNFDLRRFRANIVVEGVDVQEDGFPENSWVGKFLQLGEHADAPVLAIEMPCPRCIMTTHPVAELPKDPGIMRTLVQNNNGNLGVYARIVRDGTVHEGDTIIVHNTEPGAPA